MKIIFENQEYEILGGLNSKTKTIFNFQKNKKYLDTDDTPMLFSSWIFLHDYSFISLNGFPVQRAVHHSYRSWFDDFMDTVDTSGRYQLIGDII